MVNVSEMLINIHKNVVTLTHFSIYSVNKKKIASLTKESASWLMMYMQTHTDTHKLTIIIVLMCTTKITYVFTTAIHKVVVWQVVFTMKSGYLSSVCCWGSFLSLLLSFIKMLHIAKNTYTAHTQQCNILNGE